MTSKLILTRKGQWLNRRQNYKVIIDGKEAGSIKNDDSQEFELEPGIHSINCKINWMSSGEKTFEIANGKNTYLAVNSAMKFYMPLYILLLVGLFTPILLRFAKMPVPQMVNTLQPYLIIPCIVYVLLYFTFLRKKYLLIEEDSSNPFKDSSNPFK